MKKLLKLSPTCYAMLVLLARKAQSAYEFNTLMQNSSTEEKQETGRTAYLTTVRFHGYFGCACGNYPSC